MPIATTGWTPAKMISSGVISEPPPMPVMPIRTPTPRPKTMTSGSDHRPTCSPHSTLSVPAQRPSRPLPGWVQGAQPIDA